MSERHCPRCAQQLLDALEPIVNAGPWDKCPGVPPCPECGRLKDALANAKAIYNASQDGYVRLEAVIATLEREVEQLRAALANTNRFILEA